MSDTNAPDPKSKWERSPTYPFISLRKAEERVKQFWDKHRKEAARLAAVAPTWAYGLKSSGLQQTVGALKQYGLLEDAGSGEERKVMLTELGRRLVADLRDGARESARREAAMNPRLFKEYRKWINDMPSDSHCLSELELDRGFNTLAASIFLRAFKDTVAFARLRENDTLSSSPDAEREEGESQDVRQSEALPTRRNQDVAPSTPIQHHPVEIAPGPSPLSDRLKVQMTVGSISVSAILQTAQEVEVVIRFLEANKVLLGINPSEDETNRA